MPSIQQIRAFLGSSTTQQRASLSVSLALGVFCLWLLAQLIWQWVVPVATEQPLSAVADGSASVQRSVPLERLQRLNLFGELGAEPSSVEQSQEAPETTLNITLVGVTASRNPVLSAAIIQQGSNQSTYIIGDRIAGSRATLQAVFANRVILDNNGRRETLYLEGRDGSEPDLTVITAGSASAPAERRNADADERALQQQLRSIRDEPTKLLELVSISQVQNDTGLVGYRLSPASQPEIFRAAGFQAGDIAVAINGYDLTDMAQAMQAMNEIQSSTEASIRVLRNDDYVDLELRVPEQ